MADPKWNFVVIEPAADFGPTPETPSAPPVGAYGEPWKRHGDVVNDAHDNLVAECGRTSTLAAEEIAERVALTLNACRGISNEGLERLGDGGVLLLLGGVPHLLPALGMEASHE